MICSDDNVRKSSKASTYRLTWASCLIERETCWTFSLVPTYAGAAVCVPKFILVLKLFSCWWKWNRKLLIIDSPCRTAPPLQCYCTRNDIGFRWTSVDCCSPRLFSCIDICTLCAPWRWPSRRPSVATSIHSWTLSSWWWLGFQSPQGVSRMCQNAHSIHRIASRECMMESKRPSGLFHWEAQG